LSYHLLPQIAIKTNSPSSYRKPPVNKVKPEGNQQVWRALLVLNLYRLGLSIAFIGLFLTDIGPELLGSHHPTLYKTTTYIYVSIVLLSNLAVYAKRPSFDLQVHTLVAVDVVAITLLMHTSGGMSSGLGILLIVTITSGSLVGTARAAAYFYAAIASLTILTQSIYADISSSLVQTYYTQAGMLGAAFFATALLAHQLAQRARQSEQLAEQRGVDLASMAQLNEHIIQRMQAGMLVVDDDSQIRLMNQSAWHLLGMPISGPQPALEDVSLELVEQLQAWLNNPLNTPHTFSVPGGSSDILPRFNRLSREDNSAIIYLEDQKIAGQEAQQMKLASLGRMSASIAHEIRNPLGALSHAAQLLSESEHLAPAEQRLTNIIEENAQRVNTIIENVLQISRRQTQSPTQIDLLRWLQAFRDEFCTAEGLPETQCHVEVQPENLEIMIDPSQLHQVVWNLCKNALDHGSQNDGTIRIDLRGGADSPGRGPCLDVIDNGPGIDPTTARQVFEPFYTTRTQGTGLGLFLARQLCELNEANLDYIAQPHGGSCFRIRFPSSPPVH